MEGEQRERMLLQTRADFVVAFLGVMGRRPTANEITEHFKPCMDLAGFRAAMLRASARLAPSDTIRAAFAALDVRELSMGGG